MNIILLFIVLFVLLLIGVPVVFAIGLDCIIYMTLFHVSSLIQIPTKIYAQNDSYVFLAIPLFVFCGCIMEAGGISKRLIDFVYKLVGRQPGALGTVAIISCMIFSALTGSAIATTAAIGAIMYPMMVKNGYDGKIAAGMICSAGALGPIIPPSIPMVIYGSTMGVSVASLFLGGIIPGIFMGFVFIGINIVYAIKNDLPRSHEKYSVKEKLKALWNSLGVMMLPVIILGGIYGGYFTPTEAGTVASIYSIILVVAFKSITFKGFIEVCRKSVLTSGAIMCIIAVSGLFAYVLTVEKIPTRIAEFILPYMSSQTAFMLMMFVFLIIVGALMDSGPAILILAPIIAPIGVALGLNPLYIGVMFCCVLCMGAITPPFGITLFTIAPISNLTFAEVVRGAAIFIVSAFSVLLLLCFVPQIVTVLF